MPLCTLRIGLAALAEAIQRDNPTETKFHLEDLEEALAASNYSDRLQEVREWLKEPRVVGVGSRLSAVQAVNALRQQLAEAQVG